MKSGIEIGLDVILKYIDSIVVLSGSLMLIEMYKDVPFAFVSL